LPNIIRNSSNVARRIGGEQRPGSLGFHHSLHDDRQADRCQVYPFVSPVCHRPRRPQASPAVLDRLEQRLRSAHVEVRILLAGEARSWQVLGGGRRSDGDRLSVLVRQPVVGGANLGFYFVWDLRPVEQSVDTLLSRLESGRAVGLGGEADDLALQAASFDESIIRPGGEDESGWYWQSRVAQFAQVGALAAHEGNIVSAYVIEPG
jgi:hypothetical protein